MVKSTQQVQVIEREREQWQSPVTRVFRIRLADIEALDRSGVAAEVSEHFGVIFDVLRIHAQTHVAVGILEGLCAGAYQ